MPQAGDKGGVNPQVVLKASRSTLYCTERTPRTLPARRDESSRANWASLPSRGLITRGRTELDVSVSDIRHVQPPGNERERLAAQLKAALDDMPIEQQQALRDRLVEVVVHHQTTGEVDPLIHFGRSLQMTAQLHRNPAYLKSLEEAQRDPMVVAGLDVADFMQRVRDRHAQ
jgi:hypothetical protein